MSRWLKFLLAYTAATYALDVLLKPAAVAGKARAAADARGKPLLNVGAGTPGSSLRVALFGPTKWGDVNCDLAVCGAAKTDVACCDVQRLPYADKTFGAVIASHVLEHVPDPKKALAELHRVADEVFVVVPAWWAPHTWLHPGHLWYLSPDLTAQRRLR